MKNIIIRAVAVLSLMASVSIMTAYAQSPETVKFEAPFEFTIGETTLPAGKYSISRLRFNTSDILLIRDADRRGVVNFRVTNKVFKNEADKTRLIFHRYGSTVFLRQIQYNFGNTGYELFKTRSEREMIKKASAKKDDVASSGPETFEVVAITGQ